jgi:hypothetical protein
MSSIQGESKCTGSVLSHKHISIWCDVSWFPEKHLGALTVITAELTCQTYQVYLGWVGVVGIATRYRLDTLGSNRCGGREFLHLSRQALGPTQPPIQWIPGLHQGVEWPGHGANHPPSSSAEVKTRVELYIISGPLWPLLRLTLPFFFTKFT